MDIARELGELALATHLRRLGERLTVEATRVYEAEGLDFRSRWFPLVWALRGNGARSISEVARALGVSHTAVNQIAQEMDRASLIRWRADPGDARKRLLELSEHGRAVVERMEPLWNDVRSATRALLEESGHDLLGAVLAVDAALENRPLERRVRELRRRDEVEILDFRPELAARFRDLNLAWLEARFTVEAEDRRLLEAPETEVVERGGEVLFAAVGGEVVGTCALVRHDEQRWELAKMAVEAAARGRGVGRRLVEAALDRARARGAQRVFLLTSPRLEPAVTLYRSLGFREIDAPPSSRGKDARCALTLEVELPPSA